MERQQTLRDLGIPPTASGDPGDQRIRAILAREIGGAVRRTNGVSRPTLLASRVATVLANTRRRVVIGAGVAALAASTGIAAAAGVAPWSLLSTGSASGLFAANPAQSWPQTGTAPIASSVTDLGSVPIRSVGSFEYWGGQTQDGKWCMGFKAPDGVWAGVPASADGKDDQGYEFSGNAPGCATYSNLPQGGGFHWSMDEVGPLASNNASAGDLTAVIYGAIDDPASATRVVDSSTGMSTSILRGHFFALVEPRSSLAVVRLQATDASGHVVAQATPTGL